MCCAVGWCNEQEVLYVYTTVTFNGVTGCLAVNDSGEAVCCVQWLGCHTIDHVAVWTVCSSQRTEPSVQQFQVKSLINGAI